MQLAYPLLQILLYIAMLFAPADTDRISITGPDHSCEMTLTGQLWKFTGSDHAGLASIKDGTITLLSGGQRETLSVLEYVAAAVGNDWSKEPKVRLHEATTLEKSAGGFVLRVDEGKPGERVYRIKYGGGEKVRGVNVLGAVRTPGTYPLRERATLLDALAAAGGPTMAADTGKAAILRGAAGEKAAVFPHDIDAILRGKAANPPVLDRDTVYLPDRGDVKIPDSEANVISIAADGGMKVAGVSCTEHELPVRLKGVAERGFRTVVIRADKDTPMKAVAAALAACEAEGIASMVVRANK